MQRMTVQEILEHPGTDEPVTAVGWLRAKRDLGGVAFGVVADRTGRVQVADRTGALAAVPVESVVVVVGQVRQEPRAPGAREVAVSALHVAAGADSLPWAPAHGVPDDLDTRLTHRVLTLRDPEVVRVFRLQAGLAAAFRATLTAEGFTEVHTPKIVGAGMEGGAELFSVDYFGQPAFLAQSPQLYKEMLVATDLERVFEVAPVYRAEPHATRRHLNEYISLDLEMACVDTVEELLAVEERLLQAFRQPAAALGFQPAWLATPPARLTLAEAQDALARRYGKAAPPGHLDPEAERLLCAYVGGRPDAGAVFVTAWPRAVRPFYAREDPEGSGLTASFDLLAGGMEITTGGLREHRAERQLAAMALRGLDPHPFAPYLDAMRWGMPPHGGLAIGLERLTAMTAGRDNVRDACLFPRDRGRLSP